MLTFKNKGYTQEELDFLAQVLKEALLTTVEDCDGQCKLCPYALPCKDLALLRDYILNTRPSTRKHRHR